MKIVVDTNIVFSGILNSESHIGKILIHSSKYLSLYSCEFLNIEIRRHRQKLLKLTRISEEELNELQSLVTRNIHFINELLIPEERILAAENLLSDIDMNDTPFVALADHLNAKLWLATKF